MSEPRYFLKGGSDPWTEVTQAVWVRAERSAGFRPKDTDTGQPATGGFSSDQRGLASVSGRIVDPAYITPTAYAWDPDFNNLLFPTPEKALL